jgi:hypothetical protein
MPQDLELPPRQAPGTAAPAAPAATGDRILDGDERERRLRRVERLIELHRGRCYGHLFISPFVRFATITRRYAGHGGEWRGLAGAFESDAEAADRQDDTVRPEAPHEARDEHEQERGDDRDDTRRALRAGPAAGRSEAGRVVRRVGRRDGWQG